MCKSNHAQSIIGNLQWWAEINILFVVCSTLYVFIFSITQKHMEMEKGWNNILFILFNIQVAIVNYYEKVKCKSSNLQNGSWHSILCINLNWEDFIQMTRYLVEELILQFKCTTFVIFKWSFSYWKLQRVSNLIFKGFISLRWFACSR